MTCLCRLLICTGRQCSCDLNTTFRYTDFQGSRKVASSSVSCQDCHRFYSQATDLEFAPGLSMVTGTLASCWSSFAGRPHL